MEMVADPLAPPKARRGRDGLRPSWRCLSDPRWATVSRVFLEAPAAPIDSLRQRLLEVLLEVLDTEILLQSLSEGKICILLKPGGDEADMAVYRPLTMINSDMKILCKALTAWLTAHMPRLKHEDQGGLYRDEALV
ncbi:hypothetical protein NDU88_004198 [Pleurodeles waltl]|uniref:Uncharacterized protein n=1 Tax=Pleurodeles waltl TaxID=8319 RepID=A0AAV7W928_PLEWA|nr:hypothetical protein NDU88_004198 [Pleurodeles waltl]